MHYHYCHAYYIITQRLGCVQLLFFSALLLKDSIPQTLYKVLWTPIYFQYNYYISGKVPYLKFSSVFVYVIRPY